MKNILKFVFIASMFLFVSVTQIFAEEAKVSQSGVIITTAIREATIVSQDKGIVNLSFKVSNEEGAQAGIKYGVQLIKETKEGSFVADENINNEVFSIGENTTIPKTFVYTAPSYLNGKYKVFVLLKNENSLVLGVGYAGTIDLISSNKGVELLTETCSLSVSGEKNSKYNLSQGVDIASDENLTLNCSAVNSSSKAVTATPTFETHYRTIYGEIVPHTEVKNSPILFKAQEKKIVSILLPKALFPQAYDVKVLLNTGETNSNPIIVHYVIQGASATIQNFSLDANQYNKGDTANISILLSPSADSFPQNRAKSMGTLLSGATMSINISNDKGQSCVKKIEQDVSDSFDKQILIPAKINTTCNNYTANVLLKDANGNTLDEKSLVFAVSGGEGEGENGSEERNSAGFDSRLIYIVLGILIVGGVIVYFINLKKKENENKSSGGDSGITMGVLFFIFTFVALGGLMPIKHVSAATWSLDGLSFTASFDKATYAPGELIIVTGYVVRTVCSNAQNPGDNAYMDVYDGYSGAVDGARFSSHIPSVQYHTAPQVPGVYEAEVYLHTSLSEDTKFITYTVTAPATVDVKVRPINGAESDGPITLNTGNDVDVLWTAQNIPVGQVCNCKCMSGTSEINCGDATTSNCGSGIDTTENPVRINKLSQPTNFTVTCN